MFKIRLLIQIRGGLNMKTNLAHEPPIPQGEVVQFPKKERQAMSKKEEGYTPMPNFICDEGYLSALSGEAIKCLVLLNRHIKGFHRDNKSIGEALVMKLTGFKDKRTVRKSMADLAKYQLVRITKNLGKATIYTVTFEDRIKPELVTLNDTGALNVVTSNDTSVGTLNVTTTSDIKCHSVKEIYLKENIKETLTIENSPKNSVDEILNLWKPNLDSLNSWLQRAGERLITQSEMETILLEVNARYERQIRSDLVSDSKMYSNFVKWVKGDFSKYKKSNLNVQSTNLSVNDPWDDIPQFTGTVEPTEIPEDFV